MPLYEYKCDSCGTVFEVIQKFSDAPLTVHENCGGTVERLLSAPAFQFKGTGWYITDYGRGKNGVSAADRNGKEKTESHKDSKSDSKPESKPDKSSAKTETTKSSTPAAK